MRIFYNKYDLLGIEKTLDEYVKNPEGGMDAVLQMLREKIIDFKAIPKAKQTRELLLAYLLMPEITYVRAKWISKKLLDDEVWKLLAPLCKDYEDIPVEYLTEKEYYEIARSDYYASYCLHLIPLEKMTKSILIEALATTFTCLQNHKLNKIIFEKFDIDSLKKEALKLRNKRKREQQNADRLRIQKDGWIVYRKEYNPEMQKFIVSAGENRHSEKHSFTFDSFDEFYKFLFDILPEERKKSDTPRPLDWVNLFEYDFSDTDLSEYDLTGCLIRPEFLEKSQCFTNYSMELIADNSVLQDEIAEESGTALVNYEGENEVLLGDTKAKSFIRVNYNYISDIHLTHRIFNQLGRKFTKEEVAFLLKGIASSVKEYGCTLFAGDVSEYFSLNKLFYSLLSESLCGIEVFVLGNHEFWDVSLYKDSPVEDVVSAYRDYFGRNDRQIFLQNELFIESESCKYILSEEEILEKRSIEIAELCADAKTIILGGIGFTGYCKDKDARTGIVYNAESGLYRKAMTTLEEDVRQTQRFEAVYEKVKEAISDNKVIVLTHTPKECWSKEPYVANWIYVNGHTHKNIEIVTDKKKVFADNQIGYHNEKVQLKSFSIFRNKELFYEHLENGIHEITVSQYREFNRSKGIYCHVTAGIGTILLLKKKKKYMFLLKKYLKSVGREKLYILDGGVAHIADFNEQYYFDNMDIYVKAVKSIFKKYWDAEKAISHVIKEIGGEGTVHGCIIDIDFFNHAYLNPFDGTLSFYYATSTTNKYVYENIEALLHGREEDSLEEDRSRYIEMDKKYQKLLSQKGEGSLQMIPSPPILVNNTDMYVASRIIKRMQHIADNNVVRAWYDGVLTYYKDNGERQLMDFSKLFSSAEIEDMYEID